MSGIILCMHSANERWHYRVMPSLIGWVHTQNDYWIHNKDTDTTVSYYIPFSHTTQMTLSVFLPGAQLNFLQRLLIELPQQFSYSLWNISDDRIWRLATEKYQPCVHDSLSMNESFSKYQIKCKSSNIDAIRPPWSWLSLSPFSKI